MRKLTWAAIGVAFIFALAPASAFAGTNLWDDWEQAHGLSVIKVPNKGHDIIWSDEYLQGSTASGDWTHDIFGRTVRGTSVSADKSLVVANAAQEPASSARTKDGHIIVTFEDANDPGDYGIMQRYAIFDDDLNPVVPYQADETIAGEGGHSGHAAAMGNKFVIAFDDGWVDKDGILNQGTGEDIYLSVMNSTGDGKKTIRVKDTKQRYDWPVVAASPNNALILWQQIVPGKNYTRLMTATYKAGAKKASKARTISGLKCKYYNYSVTYVPKVKRYLVTATDTKGKGHLLLFSKGGKLIWHRSGYASFPLESAAAVSGNKVAIPTGKKSLTLLKVSKKSVKKVASKKALTWTRRGQAGCFTDKNHVVYYTLGATGLKKATVSFKGKRAASIATPPSNNALTAARAF